MFKKKHYKTKKGFSQNYQKSHIFVFKYCFFYRGSTGGHIFHTGKTWQRYYSKKRYNLLSRSVPPLFPFPAHGGVQLPSDAQPLLAASVQRVTRHFSYISPHYLLAFYWADTSTARSARAVSRRLLSPMSSPRCPFCPPGAPNKYIMPILTIS
jgi:hypothetical protein